MYKKTLSKDYTDTAITLSRLYGIAETLYLGNTLTMTDLQI